MDNNKEILSPWYAVNDDPAQYSAFTSRLSGADGKGHREAGLRRCDMTDPARQRAKAYVEGVNWLRTITRATRRALGGEAYTDERSRPWYERQRADGLRDVYYYWDNWSSGPLRPGDRQAVICWYASGKVCYFTVATDGEFNLSLVERELLDKDFHKPELTDNSQQLANVLSELAQHAGGSWGSRFLRAAQEARQGNLEEACNLSQTGGGMGSWHDTPWFEATRELTTRLGEERHHALLYLINCR